MAIIKAIVAGERDSRKLAQLRDGRCHKSEEEIAGYESELLRKMAEMEREDARGQEAPKLSNLSKGRKILAEGDEPMRQALYRISGVDLA